MNAEEFLPDADTLSAIEADLAKYNERRAFAEGEVDRRTPSLLVAFGVFCATLVYLLWDYFSLVSEQFGPLLFVGGIFAIFFLGRQIIRLTNRIGVDTQQEFRDHIVPVLFGFVEQLRYSNGYEPGSFSRLPAPMKDDANHRRFDDIISGRLNGRRFEICEMVLSYRSKNSDVVRFKGLVLCCGLPDAFEGTLVALRRPEPGFREAFDRLLRSVGELFGSEKLESIFSRSPLDKAYEFRTDNPDAARAMLRGRLGEVLGWLEQHWVRGAPRLAVRRGELFVMLPSERDFFELPPLHHVVSYNAHLKPMVEDFAALMAIVAEVQREKQPAGPEELALDRATEVPRADDEETFVRLLDDVAPAKKES